jgi:hypothetical protein
LFVKNKYVPLQNHNFDYALGRSDIAAIARQNRPIPRRVTYTVGVAGFNVSRTMATAAIPSATALKANESVLLILVFMFFPFHSIRFIITNSGEEIKLIFRS